MSFSVIYAHFDLNLVDFLLKERIRGKRDTVSCNPDGTCVDGKNEFNQYTYCCNGDCADTDANKRVRCHSCTYKNCCFEIYTDPAENCPIPGWHSDEYSGGR